MDKLLFETATLADALQKASRVAPTKGVPFDRAQGVVIDVDPARPETVVVFATNLTVSIRLVVGCLDVLATEPFTWRLPTALVSGLVSALPMTSGSTVTLASDGSWVYVLCGDIKAKVLPIMVEGYPRREPFDEDGMELVPNLAARLAQVSWAVAEDHSALGGVHLDGSHLFACDRYCLAFVPCPTPVAMPVTAPLGDFATLIRTATDVRLRATEGRIELMPDAYTQMTATIHTDPYPDVVQMLARPDSPFHCVVPTAKFIAALDRMMVLVRGERMPRLRCHFGQGVIGLEMEVEDVGKMVDRLEVAGGDVMDMDFTPTYLYKALQGSGREHVTIGYGPTPKDFVVVSDDNQYVSMIVPRVAALDDSEVAA